MKIEKFISSQDQGYSDKYFMMRALALAKRSYNPSPNPKVGAIIVKNEKVIGQGFHEKAGKSHAEIVALRKAGKKAQGATLFVTLEPCNHKGKTPPCTQAIIKSGIAKVVIGMLDPNPLAKGGANFLQQNGIETQSGILEKECRELNQIWLKNIQNQLPYLTLKIALDKQGSMAPPKGKKWITGEKSRRLVHKMRANHDAILVGVNTIIQDNPRLTVRGLKVAKQPLRIVLDGSSSIPKNAKILKDGGKTLVMKKFEPKKLWKKGVTSILVEGGEKTAKYFLEKNLVDKVYVFQNKTNCNSRTRENPKVFDKKIALKKIKKLGKDTLFEAKLKKY